MLILKVLAKARPPQMQRHHRRRQQETLFQKERRGTRRTNFFQMHGIDVNNPREAMTFLSQKLLLQFLPMSERLRRQLRTEEATGKRCRW